VRTSIVRLPPFPAGITPDSPRIGMNRNRLKARIASNPERHNGCASLDSPAPAVSFPATHPRRGAHGTESILPPAVLAAGPDRVRARAVGAVAAVAGLHGRGPERE